MQDRPDKTVLLQAVAELLGRDVLPAVTDKALAFRVRIAAHLLAGVAREVQDEPAADAAHLTALQTALGVQTNLPEAPEALRGAIRTAQATLCEHIRSAELSSEDQHHLRGLVRGPLGLRATTGNPRFSLAPEIEP